MPPRDAFSRPKPLRTLQCRYRCMQDAAEVRGSNGTKVSAAVARAARLLARPAASLLDFPLDGGDFFDAPGVPPALEGRGQPQLDHAVDQAARPAVGRQAEHVGVVVAAAHFGGQIVVAGGRADAGKLVGGDAHAQAGAADQDAALGLAVADLRATRAAMSG